MSQELKQVILVRADLEMGKGKIAAQVAHASIESYEKAKAEVCDEWRALGAKKIVLKVGSLEELLELEGRARAAKLPLARIVDAGHTELAPGTTTCLGIGPAPESEIDKVTGGLKML